MTEAARLRVTLLYFTIGFCAQVAAGADNMGFLNVFYYWFYVQVTEEGEFLDYY